MTRRELLKSAAMVGAVGAVGGLAVNAKRYGPITVERWMEFKRSGVYLHVFYEGRDITTDCMFADDTGDGIAHILLRSPNGHAYFVNTGTPKAGVAKKIVHGVTIREGAPL